MNKHCMQFAASLGLLVAASSSALAQGFWLRDAPITQMTNEDRSIAEASIKQALEQGRDGEAVAWENPATGASGTTTPGKSFERDGKTCRKTQFVTSAGGRNNESSWTLCKFPTGWKAIDP